MYRQIRKHESFEDKNESPSKENPHLWSKFAIVSIFIAVKYIQKYHNKTIWQTIQQKYSELEGDLFHPPIICVCRFDGSKATLVKTIWCTIFKNFFTPKMISDT